MTSPTTKSPLPPHNLERPEADNQLSLTRLYLLRFGYLVIVVGTAITKWPLIFNHVGPWPLFHGVETCMLLALSLLSLLGLRYPNKMLPILLFEITWKLLWLAVIAIPLLISGDIDEATSNVFQSCLWVVIIVAVVPWGHVVRQYIRKQGDPWRSGGTAR